MPKNYDDASNADTQHENGREEAGSQNANSSPIGHQFLPFLKSIFSLGTEATQFSEEVLKVVLKDFSREITQAARNGVAKGSGEIREIIHKEINAFLKSMDVASLVSQILSNHEIKVSAHIQLLPKKSEANAGKQKENSSFVTFDLNGSEEGISSTGVKEPAKKPKEKKKLRAKISKAKVSSTHSKLDPLSGKIVNGSSQTRRKIESYLAEEAPQENLTLFQSEKGSTHDSKH